MQPVSLDTDEHQGPSEIGPAIDRIKYLRGRMLTSYAQVEFLIGDLYTVTRLKFAASLPPTANLPFTAKGRMKKLTVLLNAVPAFDPYRADLLLGFAKLPEFDKLRHALAHGYLDAEGKGGKLHHFRFLIYQFGNSSAPELHELRADLESMELRSVRMAIYSQTMMLMCRHVYMKLELEGGELMKNRSPTAE